MSTVHSLFFKPTQNLVEQTQNSIVFNMHMRTHVSFHFASVHELQNRVRMIGLLSQKRGEHWTNVGPLSQTMDQHWFNVFCCWNRPLNRANYFSTTKKRLYWPFRYKLCIFVTFYLSIFSKWFWMRRESVVRFRCQYPMNLNSFDNCICMHKGNISAAAVLEPGTPGLIVNHATMSYLGALQRKHIFIYSMETKLFKIIIDVLVISFASFEYLWYGSTAIINILLFQCGARL